MFDHIKSLIEGNAASFLIFFTLSVVANVFQILSFLGERRRSREQAKQRQDEHRLLTTYEFLFSRAEKQVMSEAELKSLDAEIDKKSSSIPELERRIDLLRVAAKREVVAQNIDRNITVIRDAYEELRTLRADYVNLGPLPDLPPSTLAQIEAEVKVTANRPFVFPKSLAFRCSILVLFVMLLPWPADTVLTVVFLHVFLSSFFEAAQLSRETEITQWISRQQNKIGIISAIGAWYMLMGAAKTFLPLPFHFFDSFVMTIPISVFAGLVHWRVIVARVINRQEAQQMAKNVSLP